MRCLNPACRRDGIPVSTNVCPHCGIYLPSLLRDVLPVGTQLREGTYRIDYPLGRGGFGITYRAFNTLLDKVVAIKEFYPEEQAFRDGATGSLNVPVTHQESYERGLQRFIREGRILAGINHDNVVRVYDLFKERNTTYLVMENINGQTLQDRLKAHPENRLPQKLVGKIIEQLVFALETVHQSNVYHLDLKPDNVLLTPEDRAVLVDFGAARQGFSSHTTQAYTLDYAAPEVIAGEDVGPESDIFELGIMLYEMLTGERPPSALKRLRKDNWEPEEIEDPWRSLVVDALQMRKEDRPNSVLAWWEKNISLSIIAPPDLDPRDKTSTSDSDSYDLLGMIEEAMGIFSSSKSPEPEKKASEPPKPTTSSGLDILEQLDDLFE